MDPNELPIEAPEDPDAGHGTPRRLSRLSGILAGAFALLASAEALLRLACGPAPAPPPRPDLRYFDEEALDPFFKPGPSVAGGKLYEASRPGSLAPSFIMPKAPDVFRVFVVGGSVGLPYGKSGNAASSLTELLKSELPAGKSPEIIGCAMAGYDSPRERVVVREISQYQPDLVILMTGNNENGRTTPKHPNPVLRRLLDILGQSRLYFEARRVLAPWLRAPFAAGPSPLSRERILARFDNNLRAMARRCRLAKARLLLCALPANLRDWPPRRFIPKRWLDNPDFLRGRMEAERGLASGAIRELAAAVASAPADPVPRFYLARALEAARDYAGAKKEYESALNESFPSGAATPGINLRLRRIAREKGLLLADVDAAISSASAHGIPGYDIFLDHCHWREEFYPLVNASIIQAWRDRDRRDEGLLRAFMARLNAARRLAAAPLRDPTRILLEPLYASPTEKSCLVDERLANALETVARQDDASLRRISSAGGYAAFLSSRMSRFITSPRPPEPPPWPCFVLNVAESQRRMGRTRRAIRLFKEVLKLRPLNAPARLGLAVSLAQAGRRAESKPLFDKLQRGYPEREEIAGWRQIFFAN